MLVLIEGPAGGGKSQLLAAMLAAGEVQVYGRTQLHYGRRSQALYEGLTGQVSREGRDDDPALGLLRKVPAARTAVRQGLSGGR